MEWTVSAIEPFLQGFQSCSGMARHGCEDPLIEICSDGELNAVSFTVVDDLCLIGGAVGSESGDLVSPGHLPDTMLDKGEISAGRGNIALSEFISYH